MLSGVLRSFLNIFNILVGILAWPVLLLELSDFIISSISFGSVGDKKNVREAGLSRKSWYLVSACIYNLILYFLCNSTKEFVERMCSFKGISYLLIINVNTVDMVLFGFLELLITNSLPCFFSVIMFWFIDSW